jgi:hypothetical protein
VTCLRASYKELGRAKRTPPPPAADLLGSSSEPPRSKLQRVKRRDLNCEPAARLSRRAARYAQPQCERRAPIQAA